MALKTISINGFKSFAHDTKINLYHPVTAIVGPNGSGKSNVADAVRFALGEQSIKSLRGGKGEDLIFNGSHKIPRKNRAHVSLIFDNSKKIFNVDTSEVELQRQVHRDGVNEYLVNAVKTRLKDKMELIATANIGPTGHHLITQGEADKYVTVNDVERRQLIEDALGLNVYKLRRKEATQKLSSTAEKLREVNNHIAELEPIVKALSVEVDRLESLQQKEIALKKMYAEMFYLWKKWLAEEGLRIENELDSCNKQRQALESDIDNLERLSGDYKGPSDEEITLNTKHRRLQKDLDDLVEKQTSLSGELGGLQAKLEIKKESLPSLKGSEKSKSILSIEANQVEDLHEKIQSAKSILAAKQAESNFYTHCFGNQKLVSQVDENRPAIEAEISELQKKITEKTIKQKSLHTEIESLKESLRLIEGELRQLSSGQIESVKKLERAKGELNLLKQTITDLNEQKQELLGSKEHYTKRYHTISSLYGRSVIETPSIILEPGEKIVERLRDTKRQVLRLEAQLEDADLSSLKALRNELEIEGSRLTFLQAEKHDVETTVERTKGLVNDLTNKIETKIEVGLSQINQNLEQFFRVLFGGGGASLKSTKENDNRGVSITLQLPYKRIKSIHALSGGERSLASLAILFAITLLSPPPFVVLDETDAALDEANSRRYAKLIRKLAEHTQLILITHNRETMTFADELYGVTMGSDGVSRLLSVKLTDAMPMISQ